MLNPGTTFGPYQIRASLGEGGMGMVYEALDTRLDRPVALKVLNDALARDKDYRKRLAEEAKRAAQIDSPYVVKVWEQGEHDDQPYISMELVTGPDLRTAAATLSFEQKLNVAYQLACGLQAAHNRKLIHRDLKPENIRLNADGQVRILDFGLAKEVTTNVVDAQGDIEGGTLQYMSPEQVSSEPLSAASDVFSYGAVLFELFTGELPFDAPYRAAIIYSILHEDPPSPASVKPELPQWLDQLILKSLSKQPQDRFADFGAVLTTFTVGRNSGLTKPREELIRPKKSVTVIDIKNLSGDPHWNYFCEGFSDDLVSELARRTDLIVAAEPTTSFPRDMREIFRQCRSDYVVTGSLLPWQEVIRLNLNVYADGGSTVVVTRKYEGPTNDLLKLLSDAAKDAAEALAKVSGFSAIDVDDYLKTDFSAYDYYLKAKSYYATQKPEDLKFAAELYRKAVDVDANLALAWAGLADVYSFQYDFYYDRTEQRIEEARVAAQTALTIAQDLPEAHRSLGRVYMFRNDEVLAEKCFRRAVELNPKYFQGFRQLAWFDSRFGRLESAVSWASKALKLAPTDLETLLLLSQLNMDQRRYTVALATLQRAIELGPDFGRAYFQLGCVYQRLGVLDLALEHYLLAIKYKGDPNCCIDAGYIYLINRDYDCARQHFNESIKAGYFPFVALYYLGYLEKRLGNTEAMEHCLIASIETGKSAESPEFPNVHIKTFRALALAALDRPQESLGVLADLQRISDLDGDALHIVARAYAVLGMQAEAKRFVELALAIPTGPTEKELRFDPHLEGITDATKSHHFAG